MEDRHTCEINSHIKKLETHMKQLPCKLDDVYIGMLECNACLKDLAMDKTLKVLHYKD